MWKCRRREGLVQFAGIEGGRTGPAGLLPASETGALRRRTCLGEEGKVMVAATRGGATPRVSCSKGAPHSGHGSNVQSRRRGFQKQRRLTSIVSGEIRFQAGGGF